MKDFCDEDTAMDRASKNTGTANPELLHPVDSGARYIEFGIALHGALVDDAPALYDSILAFEQESPVVCGRASWGFDLSLGRGWLQIAPGVCAEERARIVARFDKDMRTRGLVPVARTFMR
jgi:hypothetical protein